MTKVHLGDIAPGETKRVVVKDGRVTRDDTMPPTRLCIECREPMSGTSCSFGTITPLHRHCLDIVEKRSLGRMDKKARRRLGRHWWGVWLSRLFKGGG